MNERIADAAVDRFLADRLHAVVATTRPSGRPHATVSHFVAGEGELWLPVMAGAARRRNVESTAAVTVVVLDGDGDDHTMVIVEGDVQVVVRLPDGLAEEWVRRYGAPAGWAEAWLKVTATKVLSYAGPDSRYRT